MRIAGCRAGHQIVSQTDGSVPSVVNSVCVSFGRATKHCCKWQYMRQSCYHCIPVVVNCSICEDSLTVCCYWQCVFEDSLTVCCYWRCVFEDSLTVCCYWQCVFEDSLSVCCYWQCVFEDSLSVCCYWQCVFEDNLTVCGYWWMCL